MQHRGSVRATVRKIHPLEPINSSHTKVGVRSWVQPVPWEREEKISCIRHKKRDCARARKKNETVRIDCHLINQAIVLSPYELVPFREMFLYLQYVHTYNAFFNNDSIGLHRNTHA